jgi:serine carboxypeptidase-like clade 1
MRSFILLALIAFVALYCNSVSAAIAGDLITELPGFGKTPTPQYSGLIPVDEAQSQFLHYWFVESKNNSATDPVVLWMNGGPGCSSIEGYLFELGPLHFTGETDNSTGVPTLMENPSAWTNIANFIFLEQPAGVGFSYNVNGSLSSDDFIQSQNTYAFILNFFAAYPEFANNDFYITGESYAGIYVPTLANRIRLGNAAGNPKVNLKGFAVGNGCIGNSVGTCGNDGDSDRIAMENYFGHDMISQPMYAALLAACGNFSNESPECQNLITEATNAVGNINIYDVYDDCGDDTLTVAKGPLRAPNPRLTSRLGDAPVCTPSSLMPTWLDLPEVRKAIHVDQVPNVPTWQACNGDIVYDSNLVSLLPLYPTLIENYRVLIYSGDADACVPHNGSEEWVRELGIPVKNPWHQWSVTAGGQTFTGGFVVEYDSNGLRFVTVKHAGHMVPQFEPEKAYIMFSNWLTNQDW